VTPDEGAPVSSLVQEKLLLRPETLALLTAPLTPDVTTFKVYEALRNKILDYSIPPSTRIIIQHLARDFGVSPTPVREALRLLQGDNLLVATSNKGYATTGILNKGEVDQLYEFRLLIEPWAARVSTFSGVGNPSETLLAELHTMRNISEKFVHTLISHDNYFHSIILASTGNHTLLRAYEQSRCHLHLFRRSASHFDWNSTIAEHEVIAHAIGEGDPEASEAAMRDHLFASYRRVSHHWTGGPGPRRSDV